MLHYDAPSSQQTALTLHGVSTELRNHQHRCCCYNLYDILQPHSITTAYTLIRLNIVFDKAMFETPSCRLALTFCRSGQKGRSVVRDRCRLLHCNCIGFVMQFSEQG